MILMRWFLHFSARRSPAASVAFVALLLVAGPQAARAQSLFVNYYQGQFGTLNVSTGASTLLGTTSYNGATILLGGLANASNGNLYGIESNFNGGAPSQLRLFQVNRANGALSLVGAVSAFSNSGQGFAQIGNTSDGTLYATYTPYLGSTNQTLYTLNASSAVATQVGTGNTGFMFDGGIVGDGSGNLFGFGGPDFDLADYRISRTSGMATRLQSSVGTYVLSAGFTNGTVYAFGNSSGMSGGIYTFNATTGALTNTGQRYTTTVTGEIFGAANVTPFNTPEPGTLPLLGIGLVTGLGAVGTVRRRKVKQQGA